MIIAVARDQICVRPVLSAGPAGPEATFLRGLHARGHRERPVLLPVRRHWIEAQFGRDMDGVQQLLRNLDGWLWGLVSVQRSHRHEQPNGEEEQFGFHGSGNASTLRHGRPLFDPLEMGDAVGGGGHTTATRSSRFP